MTDQFGIIGWPVEHSLSPVMHNAAFDALEIDGLYERYPVEPEKLEESVAAMKESGVKGWNVTVPHKQGIIPFLDELDPVAEAAASVNTVLNVGGKLKGFTTDGYGLEKAVVKAFDFDFADKHVLFVGAGGAAQACAVHFATLGIKKLTVLNRTVSKAEGICERAKKVNEKLETVAVPLHADNFAELVADVDLIIQSTSIELKEGVELHFDFSVVPKHAVIMDMIYNRITPFLANAHAAGLYEASGADMLLYQGMKSFQIWTGAEAPEDVMREALSEATK